MAPSLGEDWKKSEDPVLALASGEGSAVAASFGLTPPHHPPPRQFLSPCVYVPNLPTALLHHQGHHQPLDKLIDLPRAPAVRGTSAAGTP